MRIERHRETPWGREELLWQGEGVTVKIITVRAGHRLSLQSHAERDERWFAMTAGKTFEVGASVIPAAVGTHVEVPRGAKHRISAGTSDFHVLEVALGRFDQDDIVRYEDDYGRVDSKAV